MTKQGRNMVIAACVAGALGASVLLLNTLPGGSKTSSSSTDGTTLSAASTTATSLLSIKSSALRSVRVTNKNGSYTISLSGSTYSVDTLKKAPVNQDAVKTKVADVLDLKATSLVKKDVSDLAAYGLASPTATVAVTGTDGKINTFKIGSKTPTGSGVYITKPDTNDVYISSTMMNDDLSQGALQYASTTVSALSTSAKITSFLFGGTARSSAFTIAVTPVSSSTSSSSTSSGSTAYTYSYALSKPFTYETNDTNVGKVTSALQSLSATSVASVDVSAASLAKYGLLHPAYTLTYTADGKKTTLSFGTANTSGNTIYMTISDKQAIYEVDTSSAAVFYNYQLSDVLSTSMTSTDVDSLKTLTVQSGGKTYTFNVTGSTTGTNSGSSSGSGSSLTVTDAAGKTINVDSFENYFQTLLSVATRGGANKPSGVSSTLTITFTPRTGAKRVVSFLPYGSDKSFMEINGNGAMYVYNSSISSLVTLAQNLEDGKTVSSPS